MSVQFIIEKLSGFDELNCSREFLHKKSLPRRSRMGREGKEQESGRERSVRSHTEQSTASAQKKKGQKVFMIASEFRIIFQSHGALRERGEEVGNENKC